MKSQHAIKTMRRDFSQLNQELTALGKILNERPSLDCNRVYFTLCMQREKLADLIGEVEIYDEQGESDSAVRGIREYWESERPYYLRLIRYIGSNLGREASPYE